MKNLLIVIALLFSSIAFAEDTTLALTGFTLEKGQILLVELRSEKHYFIDMMRVPTDVAEGDEVEVVLQDAIPGSYEMRITVYEFNARNVKDDSKLAIGKALKQQITKITIE